MEQNNSNSRSPSLGTDGRKQLESGTIDYGETPAQGATGMIPTPATSHEDRPVQQENVHTRDNWICQEEIHLLSDSGEWVYQEEGKWSLADSGSMESTEKLPMATYAELIKMEIAHEDLIKSRLVRERGYPNRWGVRIPIQSRWDLDMLEEELQDYHDKDIVEWLRYGWPAGRLPTMAPPDRTFMNHAGATEHQQALKEYVQKESSMNVIIGPLQAIPVANAGISPLSTRPKKNSEERRVILDLSWPPGNSVNDGMVKDNYLGFEAKLVFPHTDDLAFRLYSLGRGALMFKIDFHRYFRQIPLDPADYTMIGYIIDGELYFDKVLPMGMRTAPYIAQWISNAIKYIHERLHECG